MTKTQLLDEVWPNAFVSEANLSVHIATLRKALRQGTADHSYIETVPKFGYRFIDASESTQRPSFNSLVLTEPTEAKFAHLQKVENEFESCYVTIDSGQGVLSLAGGLRIEARTGLPGTEISVTMPDHLQIDAPDFDDSLCMIKFDGMVLSTIRQDGKRSIRVAFSNP